MRPLPTKGGKRQCIFSDEVINWRISLTVQPSTLTYFILLSVLLLTGVMLSLVHGPSHHHHMEKTDAGLVASESEK